LPSESFSASRLRNERGKLVILSIAVDAFFVKPIEDLACAIGWFSQVAKLLLKLA
jgi:hypothetical protein